MDTIKNLIRRNKLFQKYHINEFKDELKESIKSGQKPEALLISCCDSRITPDFMFGNRPGDLFVLRNIGNLVPAYQSDNDSFGVLASIEYAINILEVSHVIVCGHSHCGACQSLYEELPSDTNNIQKWLEIAKPVKEFTLKSMSKENKEELYRATEKNSVIFQIKNLLSYPIIKKKVGEKSLQIHGWYYDIEKGCLYIYDEQNNSFILSDDFY